MTIWQTVGVVLLVSVAVGVYFYVRGRRDELIEEAEDCAKRFTEAFKKGD